MNATGTWVGITDGPDVVHTYTFTLNTPFNFGKISTKLPGFECEWNLEKGVRELYDTFRKVGLTAEQFASRDYTRLSQLEYLRTSSQPENIQNQSDATITHDRRASSPSHGYVRPAPVRRR